MSGGPPHHPHNRQIPTSNLANTAWNHLQVPNYFPRQPQVAHMSNEHSLLHQPTWHTPTTEALKIHPHSHVLSEMFKNETLFPRDRDCVDLSLARNGNQNGELPPVPISLSVRDTNKINSLPPSALEIQAVELTKSTSPIAKVVTPAIQSASPNRKSLSPGLKSSSPGLRTVPPYPKTSSPILISTASNIFPPSSSILSTTRNINQNLVSSSTLKSASPVPKSVSPGLKPSSPGMKPASPGIKYAPNIQTLFPSTTATLDVVKTVQKRSNIRVDSILERLNPTLDKIVSVQENKPEEKLNKPQEVEQDKPVSVIVQPTGNFDDNSNSSSINNIPAMSNVKDDDTVSTNSNDDSLDSTKSRRKRKPSKTIRVSKDEEKTEEPIDTDAPIKEAAEEKDPISVMGEMLEDGKNLDKEELPSDLDELIPAKARRKTSSESETIDDIAAMVQEGLIEKEQKQQKCSENIVEEPKLDTEAKPISVSVIKTKENLTEVLSDNSSSIPVSSAPPVATLAAKKANTHFVEVENKLEEMFAGIEDSSDPVKSTNIDLEDSKIEDPLLKLDDPLPSNNEPKEEPKDQSVEGEEPNVEEQIGFTEEKKSQPKKPKRIQGSESTPKKKKASNKSKGQPKIGNSNKKTAKQKTGGKIDQGVSKDIYAYDSGSNTSSTKSRGPFIQIKGPRDSPLSVNVINSAANEEDGERKLPKSKKFHDDTEYRHKVRSKGLHSSTLSNKYDAQTRDATWICAFCKRGPHASQLTGPTFDRNIEPPGDLFGPYFITTQCPEFERRLDDPYDRQFKSKKVTKALDEAALVTKGKKSKRKHSDSDCMSESELSDIYLGITETSNKTYEIWAHEDCIVWSNGTYLIGPKIVGLEAAVWTSCNVTCKSCHLKGANILCFRRGCLNAMHICCARSEGWQFSESNFKVYCQEHRVP
ncbi:uncharacterized protein CG5098 isoform X1 [Diorhabda carinulata]|uniref:uncharacterized protein CG5098 isoform X1 n=1 Tax=Diorhabda carinulata TaxID=1163345 RepID=UPI0025A2F256|nr:uncharacterized protein CG5098 isoform X1 [Diorhabda carinulata]XP_057666667.1 uncharacterized protein CG5098 isoform X1 [Diorhabda carinulata]